MTDYFEFAQDCLQQMVVTIESGDNLSLLLDPGKSSTRSHFVNMLKNFRDASRSLGFHELDSAATYFHRCVVNNIDLQLPAVPEHLKIKLRRAEQAWFSMRPVHCPNIASSAETHPSCCATACDDTDIPNGPEPPPRRPLLEPAGRAGSPPPPATRGGAASGPGAGRD